MAKYLDYAGLEYFWGKIKAHLDTKADDIIASASGIAEGETITPGTNCTETNLAAALNAINA